jgi:DNA polymerase-3 subunit epsilon
MATSQDRALFVDVETTGLHGSDRIVSLGAIELDIPSLRQGRFEFRGTYLIFNPGKKSHPQALAVHGFSDWVLQHQEPFEAYAQELKAMFLSCNRVVAHNASFDQRFISNEFHLAGAPLNCSDFYCTMQAYRLRTGGPAGLDAVMARMGVGGRGKRHGAFEDAWRAMMVYLWLHDLPVPSLDMMPETRPVNWRDAPPDPSLPQRPKRRKYFAEVTSPPFAEAASPAQAASPTVVARLPSHAETGSSLEELTPPNREMLLRALRPIAIVLMWIARAEGSVDERKFAVLLDMIASEIDRRGFRRSVSVVHGLAAQLAEIEPTLEMLHVAARAIVRDHAVREHLRDWLRAIVSPDGRATEQERRAIAEMMDAFEMARHRQGFLIEARG